VQMSACGCGTGGAPSPHHHCRPYRELSSLGLAGSLPVSIKDLTNLQTL
jgi:hypothetical protein